MWRNPCKQRTNPPTVMAYSRGILLSFYSSKVPTRLFVAFVVSVQPFADEVANHTCRDSLKKCEDTYISPCLN